MSVINQMLKDLEQRNEQPASGTVSNSNLPTKTSSQRKIIFITIIVVMLVNFAGFYFWQIYNENQSLKSEINAVKSLPQAIVKKSEPVSQPAKSVTEPVKTELATDNEITSKNTEQSENKISDLNSVNQALLAESKVTEPAKIQAQITEKQQAHQKTAAKTENGRDVVETNNPQTTKQTAENENLKANITNEVVTKPSISISRRQLTADELAAQKMQQAEQAIEANETAKAEQLLEDILLVQPEHQTARKQLAALWYGRQSFQSAINLLSQGIALSPNDHELKLMQAKVYLAQNNHPAAYQVLSAQPLIDNIEYQLTLATSAQQIANYDAAILAYKKLIAMQSFDARWHLGLAIALDSNSQFDLAKASYRSALTSGGLSESSKQFINQRLLELGE